jgi:sensor histidine kinase YesM
MHPQFIRLKFPLSYNSWIIAIVAGIIYSILLFAWLNIANPEGNQWDLPHMIFLFGSTAISIWSLYLTHQLSKRYFSHKHVSRQYLIMLFTSLPLFCIIYLIFWVVIIRQMFYGLKTDIAAYPRQLFYIITSLHLVMAFIVISSLYKEQVQKIQLQLGKMQQIAVETQLKMLQQQVDPHFLFNSLNILSALIKVDPERADLFTQKLSEVYRFFLNAKKELLISVEEELVFVQDYFYLVNCRFGEAFQLEVKHHAFTQLNNLYIIPGTLQLLVENAIKHNTADEVHPITIKVLIEEDQLKVLNPLIKKENTISGFGLENLKKRYELIKKENLSFVEKDGNFCVFVPLIKNLA